MFKDTFFSLQYSATPAALLLACSINSVHCFSLPVLDLRLLISCPFLPETSMNQMQYHFKYHCRFDPYTKFSGPICLIHYWHRGRPHQSLDYKNPYEIYENSCQPRLPRSAALVALLATPQPGISLIDSGSPVMVSLLNRDSWWQYP